MCFSIAKSQNREIKFQEGNWDKILSIAKQENKMVFVDCYTSWCGPCKMLAKNVFTNDSVADFYNKNFVCVKFDMEKGEGTVLRKRYQVEAYPSLLFVDAVGSLKHCVTGYMKPEQLVEQGKNVLEGKVILKKLQERYDAGERDKQFVKEYMEALFQASRAKLQSEVATEYINGLEEDEFYTRETWDIIIRNISDPLSPIIKKVLKTKWRFCDFVSRDSVDMFLDYTLKKAVNGFIWHDSSKSKFNQERYYNLLDYLRTIELPKISQYIASLYAVKFAEQGDIKGMLQEMQRSLDYGIFYSRDSQLDFILSFMRRVEKCGDNSIIKEAEIWVNSFVKKSKSGYYKSEYMKIRARLLRILGETSLADKLEQEAPRVRMAN